MAIDSGDNVFITEADRIRKVDTSGIITTFAGGGSPPEGLGDGGLALDASLFNPQRLAIDSVGNLVTCDIGALPYQGTAKVTLVMRPTQAGTFTNTATVHSVEAPDPVLATTDTHVSAGTECGRVITVDTTLTEDIGRAASRTVSSWGRTASRSTSAATGSSASPVPVTGRRPGS